MFAASPGRIPSAAVRRRPGPARVGRREPLVPDLPSPLETWPESRIYILEPLTKRGEMDQGILLLAYYSLSA